MAGKRLIFVTEDPAERKKQTAIGWVLLSIFLLAMSVIVWLTR